MVEALFPGLSLPPTTGLKLANAFGVIAPIKTAPVPKDDNVAQKIDKRAGAQKAWPFSG